MNKINLIGLCLSFSLATAHNLQLPESPQSRNFYRDNSEIPHEFTITTLYGSETLRESVLIELIHSQAIQRLKRINQYGIMHFLNPAQEYTRYQHSIGVLFLLRRYGASLEEQIMGLLHDVSHTVFSHVADYLFGTVLSKESYQDQIFPWYVENTDILPILQKHNLAHLCSIETRAQFKMLKDDLPNICADRLEYNLYGAYIENWLTQEQIIQILNHLHYRNKNWIFDDIGCAHLFAQITLDLSKNIWCSAWNGFIFTESAHLLKYALDHELITMSDLIFSDDETIWHTFTHCKDPLMQIMLTRIKEYPIHFSIGTPEHHDFYVKGKLRGIDPFIITRGGSMRLSEANSEFKALYEQTKQELAKGWHISYCDPKKP